MSTQNDQISSTTSKTSPEQSFEREKKITVLRSSIADLESQTAQLEAQLESTKARLRNDPVATVQRHIRLLHDYNDIKDIGQGLMGLIADARGVRQIDVQKEFGVGNDD
ncbi:hypothetical protein ASPZODRAFT_13562 [Penicilliopsis zonata CBS 506.65]|uniref:Swi5-domain-containing protein n=1 Tax=Penicilliopsis zonata CBS 506.65 TaxID=1073090 RepID=A0A1L9SNZ0_9EURO|nr:hypothetical protein ASPZODRAFT_13562 [Penicilliopsis zonata CBS 506.65]OJJ48823.1 hypothetical protein ASPZODRAFT_13562 [Penicilliopsis zonata CBS 506.65]